MNDYIYKDVTYEQFREVSDRINETRDKDVIDNEYLWGCTIVRYHGTNIRGDMTIHVSPGETKRAKLVLRLVTEVLTK